MRFEEAKEYMDGLNKFGSVLGLESVQALLGVLGNPQEALKVIHVAGTNGKGSTIAFMEGILIEAGYRVGKYTSPVVFEYLEKYQINGENIGEEAFAALVEKMKVALCKLKEEKNVQPTIFEVETAMAFEYFKDEGCDVVLLETGMGGDMDATNVCSKVLASVLVSISLDHMGFLGDTLEEIAYHKAGIIKDNCPVVVMNQDRVVLDVVERCAKEHNAPMYIANEVDLPVGLNGQWQQYNAGVAVKVMDVLKEYGYNITKEDIKEGLMKAKWPGRFEKISDNPTIIIDGAHNPDAARRLRETLDKDYKDTEFIYILGVLADKDFTEVIRTMADRAKHIITVTPPNARALEADKLKEAIEMEINGTKFIDGKKQGISIESAASIEEALVTACNMLEKLGNVNTEASKSQAILAFGSLSYLGKLKEACKELKIC